MSRFAILLTAFCMLSACTENVDDGKFDGTAIINATVIPMTGDGVKANQTILVKDGRIVKIADAGQVTLDEDASIYDASGKYVIPGLTDAHAHLFDEGDLTLYLAHGVTTILNMSGSYMHLRLRSEIDNGETVGPRIFTTGPMLKIDAAPMVEFEELVESPADAARLVAAYAAAGYDAVKVWGAVSKPIYSAIIEAAARNDIPVIGHIPRDAGLKPVLEAGQAIAHVEEYINKHFAGEVSRSDIQSAAELTAASGVPVITTLVTYEALSGAAAEDITSLLNRPGYELLDPVRQLLWTPKFNRLRTPERIGQDAKLVHLLGVMKQIASALHESGVILLAGVDSGELPGLTPGVDLHRELEILVEAGLSEYEVLKTATANFHAAFGQAETPFGMVKAGMQADLLILSANPLDDISNTRKIEAVVRRGTILDRVQLDGMLKTLQARNARTGAFVKDVLQNGVQSAISSMNANRRAGAKVAMTPILFLALGLAQQGDVENAMALLHFIAEVYPESPEPWYILAGFHLVGGQDQTALAAFDEVLRRAPDHERAAREKHKLEARLTSKAD